MSQPPAEARDNSYRPVRQKHRIKRWTGLQTFELIWLFVSLSLVAAAVISSAEIMQRKYEQQVESKLATLLRSTDEAIHLWSREQKTISENLAEDSYVREATQALLETNRDPKTLLNSPAQLTLRTLFKKYLKGGTLRGFFIIDQANINLASSRDANVGIKNLLTEQPDVLQRLWQGKKAISRVMQSDVPMPRQDEADIGTRDLTMFAGAPIRNKSGHVIALLTLRIDPNQTLFRLLNQVRPGETGEAYIFDRQGLMLSPSRFRDELIRTGRIRPNQSNATRVYSDSLSVLAAVRQNQDANDTTTERQSRIKKYTSYHDIQVVGAWQWEPELNAGLTVEQDYDEAFAIYQQMRNVIYAAGVVSGAAVLLLALSFGRGRRQFRESQSRLAAVVEHTVDSIVIINVRGIIQSVNPATEKVFGYRQSELIGRNVSMLMPAPHNSQHDEYIARFMDTREARVIGTGREIEARRADGSIFPAELTVSKFDLDSGVHFAGTLRDLTQRRETESALAAERHFSQMALDALGAHIAVLDESGTIVAVNRAWREFAHSNGIPEEADMTGENYIQVSRAARGVSPEDAHNAAQKLSLLLTTDLHSFSMEFPCHQPEEELWFQMRASRFDLRGKPMVVVSHTDITERRQIENELRMKSLVAAETDSGVVITDLEQQIKWVNPGFTAITGFSFNEVIGRKPGDFLQGPETEQDALRNISEAIRKRERIETDITNYHKSGRSYILHLEIMPVKNDSGEVIEFIALEKDVTEQRRSQALIKEAKEAAEAANQAKSSFLAAMSHEIRTPLNGVVGSIDLLSHTHLESNQLDMIRTVQDSASTLLGIIDNILDFSKIEAGRLDIAQEPISIRQIVESCVESLHPVAIKKDVELFVFCDPIIPEVLGDPVRIRQILFNLIGNAIKFSAGMSDRKSQVEINALLDRKDDKTLQLRLQVRDNGIGIAPDVQSQLFKPFTQAENSTTRRFGGTGLGLVISNRLVNLMGGSIELESQPDQGALFTIKLTLEQAEEKLSSDHKTLSNIKVLLIEGEQQVTRIITSYLRHEGADIVSTSPSTAMDNFLQCLAEADDTLVVVDTQCLQKGTDKNQELMRRQAAGTKDVRFLLINHGRRRYARTSGEDTMTLDISAMQFRTLINAVAALAGIESLEFGNVENSFLQFARLPSIEQAREKGRLILVAEDNETNIKVIRQQLGMLGFATECAGDGRQALDMWRKGTYAALLTDCHMPEMDGYDLARAIRTEEDQGDRLPIIAITADALKGTAERCYAAGMDDYLTKPMRLENLAETLNRWLPMLIELEPDSNEPEDDGDRDHPIDPKVLPELLGIDDQSTLQNFYTRFIATSDPTVDQIGSALAQVNPDEVARLAHKLKSAAASVGATRLVESCIELEKAGKADDIAAIQAETVVFYAHYSEVKNWIERYSDRHSKGKTT